MTPSKLDILFLSVPVLDLQYPPSSAAVLKACIKQAGYSARVHDTNILLKDICKEEFVNVSNEFETINKGSVKDNLVESLFDNYCAVIQQWLDTVIDDIREKNPRWLGISIFSYKSHKAALLVALTVRQQFPNIKIVVGGRGASSYPFGPDCTAFKDKFHKLLNKTVSDTMGGSLLSAGIIDSFIDGDAEQEIINLLVKDTPRLSGKIETLDLETVPPSDYDDFDLEKYEYINEPTLSITGSKGCVRQCTFCDIPVLWPKFKFRSGAHIATEMISLNKRYNVNKFYMSDSLVNGSLVAFKDFLYTMADYNAQNPTNTIRWVGQYITRPVHQVHQVANYYDLLKISGAEGLTIGVESGSDAVREHMRKKFSTFDIDTEIAEFDKREITCVLLFFSCYPTETWQDFLDTAEMLIRYQKYCASGTVYKLTLGIPYTHHRNTPLWNMQEKIELDYNASSDIMWLLKDNPDLTFHERIRRRLILQELCFALALPLSRNAAELNQLKYTLQYHRSSLEEYFGEPAPINIYPDVFDITPFDQLLMPLELQRKVYSQLQATPDLNQQIKNKHKDSEQDIAYDIEGYNNLRDELGK
tara:strand:+ start:14245 stop:16005 length:1761 start_codon:yes stop_codon:yes gene_type:complete